MQVGSIFTRLHATAFPVSISRIERLRTGGTLPVVLNAANEVAVEHFLDGKLGFTAIPRVIEETMDAHDVRTVTTLEMVRRVDSVGAGVRPAYSPGARIERVTTILAFLFVLGVLVFVHELGHFLAARRIGVRVLTFSLGFGPKLHRHGVATPNTRSARFRSAATSRWPARSRTTRAAARPTSSCRRRSGSGSRCSSWVP